MSLTESPTPYIVEESQEEGFHIDMISLAGNLSLLVLDTVALLVLYVLIRYHSKSPGISIRRPWLLLLSVVFLTLYDILWAIDENTESGVMTCGGWEFFTGVYQILFYYVLLVRVLVFFVLTRKTEALTLFFNGDDVKTQAIKLKNDFKNLQLLQKISKLSFLLAFTAIAAILHAVVFFFDWYRNPDLILLSNSEYLEKHPSCYVSLSYEITKYYGYALGILVIILTVLTKPKNDYFKIKVDYLGFGIFWIIYFFISNEVEFYVSLTDQQIVYFDIYFWVASFVVFVSAFIIYPWLKYRSRELPLRYTTTSYGESSLGREEMKVVMEDENFRLDFQGFLEKEYCPEALYFWKCLKEYKELFDLQSPSLQTHLSGGSSTHSDSSNANAIQSKGAAIFSQFLSSDAIWQLNISGIALKLYQAYDWDSPLTYSKDLFDSAEDEVLDLLRHDPFRRYKQTDAFQKRFERYKSENDNMMIMEVIAPE